jgi:hypothetical protein
MEVKLLAMIDEATTIAEVRAVAKEVIISSGMVIKLSGKGRTIEVIKADCYAALPLNYQSSSLTCDVCNFQSSQLPTVTQTKTGDVIIDTFEEIGKKVATVTNVFKDCFSLMFVS